MYISHSSLTTSRHRARCPDEHDHRILLRSTQSPCCISCWPSYSCCAHGMDQAPHLYGASRELRPVVPGCAATAERCMLMQCTSSPLRRSICSGRTMGPPRFELLATVLVAWRTNASSAFVLAVTCQRKSQHDLVMLANRWIHHAWGCEGVCAFRIQIAGIHADHQSACERSAARRIAMRTLHTRAPWLGRWVSAASMRPAPPARPASSPKRSAAGRTCVTSQNSCNMRQMQHDKSSAILTIQQHVDLATEQY